MMKLRIISSAVGVVVLAGSALAVLPYSTSFETPTFAGNSALNGQDGWIAPAAFTVTSGFGRTGTQAAKWSNVGGAGGVEAYKDFSVDAAPIVFAEVWVQIAGNSDSGYYFGLRPYFNDSFIGPYADVVVNKDGDVRATQGSSGNTAVSTVGNIGNVADQWVRFQLSVDLTNDLVSATVGSLNFALPGVASSTSITDIDLYARPISPTGGSTGTAYFDDYSVSAVPEPATMLVLAGLAAASLRRRKK